MQEKSLVDSLDVMQRILQALVSNKRISEEDFQKLLEIRETINKEINQKTASFTLESLVTKFLKELGIATNVRGYEYLKYAIILKYENFNDFSFLTYDLYSAVAKKFNTTNSRIERSIRYAIEASWNNKELTKMQMELFGKKSNFKKGKPSNGLFISTVADTLKDFI